MPTYNEERYIKSAIESLQKQTNINWGGKAYRPSDIMFAVANLSSAKKVLDWTPKIQLAEGLKNIYDN